MGARPLLCKFRYLPWNTSDISRPSVFSFFFRSLWFCLTFLFSAHAKSSFLSADHKAQQSPKLGTQTFFFTVSTFTLDAFWHNIPFTRVKVPFSSTAAYMYAYVIYISENKGKCMRGENDKNQKLPFHVQGFSPHNDSMAYGCHRNMDHSRSSRLLMTDHSLRSTSRPPWVQNAGKQTFSTCLDTELVRFIWTFHCVCRLLMVLLVEECLIRIVLSHLSNSIIEQYIYRKVGMFSRIIPKFNSKIPEIVIWGDFPPFYKLNNTWLAHVNSFHHCPPHYYAFTIYFLSIFSS